MKELSLLLLEAEVVPLDVFYLLCCFWSLVSGSGFHYIFVPENPQKQPLATSQALEVAFLSSTPRVFAFSVEMIGSRTW
jgi:hypothetical protein